MTKLTFDEWRKKVGTIQIGESTLDALKAFSDVNIDSEVEKALRQQYDLYLATGDDNA